MNERFEDDDLRAAYTPRLNERTAHGPGCPSPDALLAAVRGEGPEAERLQVLDHALRCAACRPELALLQSVSGAGERSRGVVALSWFRRRLAPLAIAASLLVVAGVFGVNEWQKRTGDEIPRSPSGDAEPALIAPGSPAETGATVTFIWHPVAGALRYTLELSGSSGDLLLRTSTGDTALVAPLDTIARGEHRWSVRAHMDDGSERRSEIRILRLR